MRKASFSQAIIGEALTPGVPQWVHVLPSGSFSGRDGRGPYTCDPAKVCAATLNYFGNAEVPMDYEHQLERAAVNGLSAPASGWVKALEPRLDGVWAQVAWTDRAAACIAAKEYRYLSPVFFHDEKGLIIRIESIALTNLPNLPLKALASQEQGYSDDDLSSEERKICRATGVSEDAYRIARAEIRLKALVAQEQSLCGAGLSPAEHKICCATGVSEDAYRAARADMQSKGRI